MAQSQHKSSASKDDIHLTAFTDRLFPWWSEHARDLPWRFGRTTPWGILVCEVMSQQTQMSRVAPYWKIWMNTWPDPKALSNASTAEVITAWGHLGYPRRALRLQECATIVASKYHNHVPHTYEELVSLPGIGDYTASAVLSFAFGKRIAVIDTNIRRVLSRAALAVESLGGATSVQERELAQRMLPHDSKHSTTWNQATMELGATVCTAKNPQCASCPLCDICRFVAAGKPGLSEGRTRPRQHFKGTNRQVRGKIMQALRDQTSGDALTYQELSKLWPNTSQLDECIASLDEDGLIEILPSRAIRFPLMNRAHKL